MRSIPLLDLVVGVTREPDEQIVGIRKSVAYTRHRLASSRQHVKESREALDRAQKQIDMLVRRR